MEIENQRFTASNFIEKKKLKILTPNRLKYESESLYIRTKLGGLENVQKTLDLSGRKICQLLLVDPSCWSRWQKDESKVPPSVWKTLEWYLILREKHPFWSEKEQLLAGAEVSRPNFDEKAMDLSRLLKTPLILGVFAWAGLVTLALIFLIFR